MTLVNHATGEIVDLDSAAAERRAERISLRLDAIADNYAAVMPMIRESIEKQDHLALGYRSVGEYVADRFGGALQRLGVEVRRAVVGELTAAGMSTRAIAPVVGVSQKTVDRDVRQVSHMTHLREMSSVGAVGLRAEESESADSDPMADAAATVRPEREAAGESAHQVSGAAKPVEHPQDQPSVDVPLAPVIGIDGKTYTRPDRKMPRPAAEKTLNIIGLYAGKAARAAAELTPEQIRRVRPEADAWVVGLRQNVEALQRLIDSLDN